MKCSNIRVILVETSHPGNIGSAARAMKTMELSELCLVSPAVFPSDIAVAMSSGAEDILNKAKVFNSLLEAIGDCECVVGVSARKRGISLPVLEPHQAASIWIERIHKGQSIAFVFGREDRGLTNAELDLCQQQVCIDANPSYSSLNLAAAIQIICYDVRRAWHDFYRHKRETQISREHPMASVKAKEHFFIHLEQVMEQIDFFKTSDTHKIMKKLRHIYNRAELTGAELNILRGILTQTQLNLKEKTVLKSHDLLERE